MNDDAPKTTTRRFIVEVSVVDEAPEGNAAADELLERLDFGTLPQWVFSVDGVDEE